VGRVRSIRRQWRSGDHRYNRFVYLQRTIERDAKATRATQTAAEAAKNSADAATASVDISRQVMESSGKQFRTEIRAYLSMVTARQSLSPIEGPTENQPYIRGQQGKYCVDVIYTNEGKTPVVGKRTTAHLILNDNPQQL